jgi:hypothetical protein
MSNPFGGFNQHPAEEPTPAPAAPRNEGLHQPPVVPTGQYKTTWRDMRPSTAPDLTLGSAASIASGVARELARHDAQIASSNGDEHYAERKLRDDLARNVKSGAMTESEAQTTWKAVFGTLDPASIK